MTRPGWFVLAFSLLLLGAMGYLLVSVVPGQSLLPAFVAVYAVVISAFAALFAALRRARESDVESRETPCGPARR